MLATRFLKAKGKPCKPKLLVVWLPQPKRDREAKNRFEIPGTKAGFKRVWLTSKAVATEVAIAPQTTKTRMKYEKETDEQKHGTDIIFCTVRSVQGQPGPV